MKRGDLISFGLDDDMEAVVSHISGMYAHFRGWRYRSRDGEMLAVTRGGAWETHGSVVVIERPEK